MNQPQISYNEIVTRAFLKKMVALSLMAIFVLVLCIYIDKDALNGRLPAVSQAHAGGSWGNARKYIEGCHHGGKGSDAHKGAVIGYTVGDPLKTRQLRP